MPVDHSSKIYAVSDAKIGKVTADPSGGTTTYASLIDVPGIKEAGIGGDVNSVELRGDNTSLDYNATLGALTLSVTHAKVSLDVLPVLLGGTTTDSGAGSTEVATYVQTNTNTFNYWKFEAKTPTNGADPTGGDLHVVLYKCILTSFPEIGFAEEDYQILSFEARAVPRLSDGKIFDIVLNETAAAIV